MLGKLLRLLSRRWDHSHSQLVLVAAVRDLLDDQVLSIRRRLENPRRSVETVNGQLEGMPWSQWSFVFWSYLGAFDPTATRLLRQVESNVEDPVVVDNTSMTGGRDDFRYNCSTC